MRELFPISAQSNTESVDGAPARLGPLLQETESSGVLVLDKPEGMTSSAVVTRIKRQLGLRKAGHCGTLDPFATGVLLVCVNQATRIADQLTVQTKTYRFTVRFGIETDTLDRTGRVVRTCEDPAPPERDLLEAVRSHEGTQVQQVPRYAAVKVQGKRLYELARKGIEVEPPQREVRIHSLSLISYRYPEAVLETTCSKGTYVRQLAADLGGRLGCGAHVTHLRRLACGPFCIEQASTLERMKDGVSDGFWLEKLVSMSGALSHLPALTIEDERILGRLRFGQLDAAWETEHAGLFPERREPVRIVTADDRLAALWWPHPGPAQHRRLRLFQF
jgi:tRNA pseudouridine55 synthase